MHRMREFAARFRALFSQFRAGQAFDSELEEHVSLLTERYLRQGLTEKEAKAEAIRQFRGLTQLKEAMHEQRGIVFLEQLFQDGRYALRQLRKSPAFSLTAVLTLALGIGVNTAVFSVAYAVLLRPLPFPRAEQLTVVWEKNASHGWFHNIVSAANFNDWSRQNDVFSGIALIDPFLTFNLTGNGSPLEVKAERTTPNVFPLLGVSAALGRTFLAEEGRPGSARVVILSHGLWKRRFAGDASLVGRQIPLNSESYTVIGIMPAGFESVYSRGFGESAEVWISGLDRSDPGRTNHNYIALARRRAGVSLPRAQAEMDTIAARLEKQYPDNRGWGVQLVSLHDEVVGNSRPALLILLAGVGVVLLIACANLANLLVARGLGRFREFAVRKALGASRRRLLVQLFTESFVLSLCGTAAGMWVAAFGAKSLMAMAPVDTPGISSAGLHPPVVLYAIGIAFVTTILFGLLPALGVSGVNPGASLKESGRGSTDGGTAGRLRKLLVASEVSLALILGVSAGLLVKTLFQMHRIAVGFQPDHVLTLRVPLDDVKYNEKQQAGFYQRLVDRLSELPEVDSASVSRGIPFFGWAGQGFVTRDKPNLSVAEMPDADVLAVGPRYFDVLRIPVRKGRVFNEHDTENASRVAIVNEVLARTEWPVENPLGKQIKVGWPNGQWLTVIGVTGNVRTQGPEADFFPEIYTAYTQFPWYLTPRNLLVRTKGINPLAIVPAIRRVVHELDSDQPIADVRTLEAVASAPLQMRHLLSYLLGGFGVTAVLLAAVGVYGVMAYSVAQRRRELGIRLALGAKKSQVLSLVWGEGVRLAMTGIAIGVVGCVGATRFLASQLYHVKATDPWIFATTALLLMAVAATAAYLPARRACSTDPVQVLREE